VIRKEIKLIINIIKLKKYTHDINYEAAMVAYITAKQAIESLSCMIQGWIDSTEYTNCKLYNYLRTLLEHAVAVFNFLFKGCMSQ